MTLKSLPRLAFAGLLSAALVACGGGGGGGGVDEPQPSQTQALFDEATLASRGGSHQLQVSHFINPTGPTLFWAATASLSMDRSPFQQEAGATATPAAPELLLQTAAAPPLDFSDNAGQAVIWQGEIHFMRNNASSTVRYQGDDVLVETESSDGAYTRRERITAITKHALRGRLDAAPEEFRTAYRTVVAALGGAGRFPDGAAYYKRTSVRVGALVVLQDSDFNAATDPQSATPFTTGTIEDVPPLIGGLDLRDGTIRRLNGARCWVRTLPHETVSGTSALFSADPTFAVLCEVRGKVYLGSLQPDGAVLGSTQPTATTFERVPYTIRLNQAAADGLRSMVP